MTNLTIFHGDHSQEIYQASQQWLAKHSNTEIIRLEAKQISLADLESALAQNDLFGKSKAVVVYGLLTLPQSNKKKALIDLLQKTTVNCLLIESKTATKTQLKPFSTATSKEFKIPNLIFKLTDSIKPSNQAASTLLAKVLTTQSPHFVLSMFVRQIRLMIQAKTGETIAGPPFVISKIKNQSNSFSLDQLLTAHQRLVQIEVGVKTGQLALDLEQELDLWLRKL